MRPAGEARPAWGPAGLDLSGMEAKLRDPVLKQNIINRLRSIEGHLRGIQRMVEEDKYCIDILNQTAAIQKALERVDGIILENHLQSRVTTAIRGDDAGERERVIRELLQLFQGGQAAGLSLKVEGSALQPAASDAGDKCCG